MNDSTLLLRQIHPNFVRGNRVSSQAFTPTDKDKGRLSVYDGDQIAAEDSWYHFTQECGYQSDGVMAVTVGECVAHGRKVVLDSEPYREHAYIDFAGLSGNMSKKVGKTLARSASERGWQFRPDQT